MVANMLVTKNLALNKVAQVLAYLRTEIASHRDQVLVATTHASKDFCTSQLPASGKFADGGRNFPFAADFWRGCTW